MKLSDFKYQLDKFTEEWGSLQQDGSIKMQSHSSEISLQFYDPEGNELDDIEFEFDQFMGCGCISGLRLNFKSKEGEE